VITFLSSGVTLGTYVPAKILAARLPGLGTRGEVEVFETLLNEEEAHRVHAARTAFRGDFKMAVTALRLVRDQAPRLDAERVALLLGRWAEQRRADFVMLSGFWQPIVARYGQSVSWPIRVDVCHLDAAATPSLRLVLPGQAGWNEVWMFDAEADRIPCTIPITDDEPLPWTDRDSRLLAHGGGWGLGTYLDRVSEVAAAGFGVDVICHDSTDLTRNPPGTRHFLINPDWTPWSDGGFPPFGEVIGAGPVQYRQREDHHDSFELARRAMAMICKTGGGTLLDSLWSATPIIALEPYGAHEAVNAALWQRLGFGTTFKSWLDGGFRIEELERMHARLLEAREGVIDYAVVLADRRARARAAQ
jgi:hypothetical protein